MPELKGHDRGDEEPPLRGAGGEERREECDVCTFASEEKAHACVHLRMYPCDCTPSALVCVCACVPFACCLLEECEDSSSRPPAGSRVGPEGRGLPLAGLRQFAAALHRCCVHGTFWCVSLENHSREQNVEA